MKIEDIPRLSFYIFVRFFVLVFLGLNVRRKNLFPTNGPAIVTANHNSHLDALVLVSLFPLSILSRIRPVAAADYFLKNRFMAWFSLNIIGIIPIQRQSATKSIDPLQPCYDALEKNQILILFPEGTRGEAEKISEFKKGVSWLCERYRQAPVTPVFIHGLGKSMGKSNFIPVPFFCDIFVGEPIRFETDRDQFMQELKSSFGRLVEEERLPEWH